MVCKAGVVLVFSTLTMGPLITGCAGGDSAVDEESVGHEEDLTSAQARKKYAGDYTHEEDAYAPSGGNDRLVLSLAADGTSTVRSRTCGCTHRTTSSAGWETHSYCDRRDWVVRAGSGHWRIGGPAKDTWRDKTTTGVSVIFADGSGFSATPDTFDPSDGPPIIFERAHALVLRWSQKTLGGGIFEAV